MKRKREFTIEAQKRKFRRVMGRARGGRRFDPMIIDTKANKALRLIRKLQGEEEIKEIIGDTSATIPNDDTWSNIPIIFGVPQTSGEQTAITRIGKKITIKSLAIRYSITQNSQEAQNAATRVVFFIDRRPRKTQVTEDEIWNTTDILAHIETQNKENKGRFQILMDKIIHWPTSLRGETSSATFSSQRPMVRLGKFYYGRDTVQEYSGTGAAIANIAINAFYMMAISSDSSQDSTLKVQYKVRFTDA